MKKTKDIEMNKIGEELLDQESNYDIRRSAHPIACIFHLLFKGAGFFCYLFLKMFISNSVIVYIVVILCDSFDFWTVKNITGRLLVGLRWWSTFTPSGREVWKFESMPQSNSAVDSSVFWTFQLAATGGWAFFAGINLMTMNITDVIDQRQKIQLFKIVLSSIGFLLSSLNLWGYYKCSKDQQKKMKGMKHFFAAQGLKIAMKSQK